MGNDNPELGPAWYIVEFDLPSAGSLLGQMRDEIRHLVGSGELRSGRGHAMDVKLHGVMDKVSHERNRAACGQLAAFDHQVAAFGRAGILSDAEADWFEVRTVQVTDLLCT